jgi:hypothetical protein
LTGMPPVTAAGVREVSCSGVIVLLTNFCTLYLPFEVIFASG